MFKPAQNNDLMDIAISGLQNSSELGLLDQKSNELELEFSIQLTAVEGGQTPNRNKKNQDPKTIHVKIAQDITALRTRKGDTGIYRHHILFPRHLTSEIIGGALWRGRQVITAVSWGVPIINKSPFAQCITWQCPSPTNTGRATIAFIWIP